MTRPQALRLNNGISWATFVFTSWLIVAPLAFLIIAAVTGGYPGQPVRQLTFDYIQHVYGSTKYLKPFSNTLLLAMLTALIVTPIGVFFAWLIARTDLRWKSGIGFSITLPIFISPLIGTLAWIALAAPGAGLINAWIGRALFGMSGNLVNIYSFPAIIFVMSLFYIPLCYLLTVAAFSRLDGTLEEAGRTVGCRPVQVWRYVTLPILMPSIISASLIIFILSAEQFAVPALLGVRGHFVTIPVLLYQGFNEGTIPPGEIAALATQLVAVTLLGVYFYRRIVRVARRYVTVTGRASAQRLANLGYWQVPALFLLGIYIALAVVLPCVALLVGSFQKYLTATFDASNWTLGNYVSLLDPYYLQVLWNTIWLATGGAFATVLLGFLIGYLTTRLRGVPVVGVDYVSSLPIAVPGIAMAAGLLWTYALLPLPIYGTALLLLIAFMARFLGYAVRLASTSFQQIDPSLEEAARMVGMSRLTMLRRIAFGLVRPSMISAWTLIFAFIVVEVSTTILLYTPQTATMAVAIFNAMESAGTVRGFTIAVVQLLIIAGLLLAARAVTGKVQEPLWTRS